MNLATGQKSPICLEEGFNPVADSYINFQSINSYCLEEVTKMPAKGCKLSDEAKAKISKANKGFRHSEEAKLKMSNTRRNRLATGEITLWCKGTKGVIIPWNKGKHGIYSDEYKAKLSKSHKGRTHSEETLKRMSEASKGRRLSEETKRKISNSHMGIRPNEETRRKRRLNCGPRNPLWKGGNKVSKPRSNAKRKRNLGFTVLNDCDNLDWVGHHLDVEYVLYIPKAIHRSIWHIQSRSKTMDKINCAALDWYINYLWAEIEQEKREDINYVQTQS